MVSWAALNTFALPVGIWLFRNGAGYYKSWKTQNTTNTPIKPAGPRVNLALNILFAIGCLVLASSLPYFSSPNVFTETNTRLQTSTDVIFNRLASRRTLTALDNVLWSKLTSKEARLIYFTYGPYVLANCPFCTLGDPNSYLYYALPTILAPHLVHIIVIALVTSSLFFGPESARWRSHATGAAMALALIELYFTATYDYRANTQSGSTKDIDFFYWRMRLLRSLGIAVIDAGLGCATWLYATNRMFQAPLSIDSRLDLAAKCLEVLNFQLLATGNVKNVAVRDKELAVKNMRYWAAQVNADSQLYEEREVVDRMREALTRLDREQQSISERAQVQADAVVSMIQRMP